MCAGDEDEEEEESAGEAENEEENIRDRPEFDEFATEDEPEHLSSADFEKFRTQNPEKAMGEGGHQGERGRTQVHVASSLVPFGNLLRT